MLFQFKGYLTAFMPPSPSHRGEMTLVYSPGTDYDNPEDRREEEQRARDLFALMQSGNQVIIDIRLDKEKET